MPFGLKGAPATFCRLGNEVFRGYIGDFVQIYLDDIVVYSKNMEDHKGHLQKVLERLQRYGLTCQPKKCKIGLPKIHFLGHVVDGDGIDKEIDKLKFIGKFPTPKKVKDIQRFLGICGWYNQFVKNYSDIAIPLTNMLVKGNTWKWTAREEQAFVKLKEAVTQAPRLSSPDYTKPFVLQTDASEIGVGAVLFQRGETPMSRHIISHASRKLNTAQTNYPAVERECLAIIWAVDKYRPYLESGHFELLTDNAALKWLETAKHSNKKLLH